MDEGAVVMSKISPATVIQAIDVVREMHSTVGRKHRVVPDYDVENVSTKIVRIVYSYIDFVNRVVWSR
jgi:UDP-N-acetylglucosamine 2-epimerase (non-hydrolysing)